MSQTAGMKPHFFGRFRKRRQTRASLCRPTQFGIHSSNRFKPNQAATGHQCASPPRGREGRPVMKKKLLAIATASLFTVGIAAAQTSTTSPTDNTSPADQSSPAALPNQGSTGTSGQPDSMGTSVSDQSSTTDQTSQSKKKKKKQQNQDQNGSTNETPAGTDSSNTPSPTPGY
jgi:hypothetical protein